MKPLAASELKATDYTLIIPNLVYQQIMYWINMTDMEVSGFGSVEVNHGAKTYTIGDVFLPKQVNEAASSEMDPNSLGEHMYKRRDIDNGMKWHWHSHVDMGVFWSGDDMNIIRGLGHRDWILASVFNKKREVRTAYMTTVELNGHTHEIFEDEMLTHVDNPLPAGLVASWEAEFKENVKEKKYSAVGIQPYRKTDEYWKDRQTSLNIPSVAGEMLEIDMLPSHLTSGTHTVESEDIPGNVVSDEYGCFYPSADANEYVYNPLTDKYLTTDAEIYYELMSMSDKELEATMHWFPEVTNFMDEHNIRLIEGEVR